ncbi:MAG TPA: ATP-binding protein [Clostridia bacterium]|nr:MAG: Archaeal ATPase [Firmicutes bacterium ADurb.Bin146]HOD93422.1 ATP-binding protein [Clostridia bacterium]HQM39678.1 ATP-binding protein [Clostridia bacterium]
MLNFIDRNPEMKFLESEYSRTGSSLVVIYGRRRIGKTELISEFIKNKNSIYFLATEENEVQNRNAFKDAISHFSNNEILKQARIDNWEILFKTLITDIDNKKIVLVIDEFQYLGIANPAFPSIIQKIWDTYLKNSNIMVILCGSLISMMESQTLNYSSPLYGRRTGQIRLKQIPFLYYHEFFPNKDYKSLIEYYSVTGGVPKYIELFYDSEDIYSAIDANILTKQSFLYDEANFLLQKEVSEVGTYFSIIKAIAAGNHKLSKIASNIEIKQTSLTKYLNTLISLDLIEREIPVTEPNPLKSKKGLYRIKDNYILFWFKFIYPNLGFIESGNVSLVMKKIKDNFIDHHVSYIYENICIEKLWSMNADGYFTFSFDKIGRWWNNSSEIDIVATDSTGNNILFGECKYRNAKIGIDVLSELEKKANEVEWNKDVRKSLYILFSISGFTDELIETAKNRSDVILSE